MKPLTVEFPFDDDCMIKSTSFGDTDSLLFLLFEKVSFSKPILSLESPAWLRCQVNLNRVSCLGIRSMQQLEGRTNAERLNKLV